MSYPAKETPGARRAQVASWLRRSLDLLFPPRCVGCSRTGSWFCSACIASVEPTPAPACRRCGRPGANDELCLRCRKHPAALDGVGVVAVHSGVLREAIHQFKYRPRRELAVPLGQMLFDHWQRARLPVDLVIPVPLHPARQKERGFNQANLLASVFCAHSELPLNAVDLVRERATTPQVGLGAREREANVRDAFSYAGRALTGVRVLLIDDVCTSGATLEACAQALQEGRPKSVWALTLARPTN